MSPLGAVPAVLCEHLNHRFGRKQAVVDLSLRIERGEIVGLLGPNGAGKTTTVRILDTLAPVQDGRVEIFGIDAAAHPMDVRCNIGYVPQQLSVDGALTARQNVAWFARLYDVPRRQVAARVDEVLEMTELSEVAGEVASRFSGGMVRRLELAQALVSRPSLLLLDEPTVGLDPVARDAIWARIASLRDDSGMTVLLTTHYMEEADVLCDRVALLAGGRLRLDGAPEALRAEIGPDATLEDVFRETVGSPLTPVPPETRGGLRDVRTSRRSAR